MTRNELRDQLLAPILTWTRLGRQVSELVVGSMNVVGDRSHQMMRSATWREPYDWSELALMAREKMAVPVASAAAVAAVLPAHAQRLVADTAQTLLGCSGSAASMAASVGSEEFDTRRREFGEALLQTGLVWCRLWASMGEIAEEALQPVLHQVNANAARLGKR